MARKRYSAEQIIRMLREAEVELSRGQTVGAVCKKLGVTSNTYHRWRKEHGGLRVDQAKRLKESGAGERLGSSGSWPISPSTSRS